MKPLILLMAACGFAVAADDKDADVIKRLGAAQEVLRESMKGGDKDIPKDLIEKAHCVAIIPGLKKAGFIVGAKYGKGFLMCRRERAGWRGPAAVRVEGGSIGFQIGGGEADVIMLVMNKSGAERLFKNEIKLGVNAGVMAGPLGRTASAETDAYMRAEILAYSRSRGVFAGISLDGSTLREDLDNNETLYGSKLSNQQILMEPGKPTPASAIALKNMLTGISTWEK